MQDAGCRMQDAGCRMQDAGCRMQDNDESGIPPVNDLPSIFH